MQVGHKCVIAVVHLKPMFDSCCGQRYRHQLSISLQCFSTVGVSVDCGTRDVTTQMLKDKVPAILDTN